MKLSLILAVGTDGLIGKGKGLPWGPIPADMKRFRDLTIDKVVVMGRETWESLPVKYRPLPKRRNVVLTRDKNYEAEGAIIIHSIGELINFCDGEHAFDARYQQSQDEIFLIGGASLVEQLYQYINKAYLTSVRGDYIGGLSLPAEINADLFLFENNWDIKSQQYVPSDDGIPGIDFIDLVSKV